MGDVTGECLKGDVSGEKFGPRDASLSSESDMV